MSIRGVATTEEKLSFVHDLAMAYMSQQDNSSLSPTEYVEKFKAIRSEIYGQIKDLADPYRP